MDSEPLLVHEKNDAQGRLPEGDFPGPVNTESTPTTAAEPDEQGGIVNDSEGLVHPASSSQILQRNVEQLIADINAKRNRDAVLLEDFKKALEMHCNAVFASTEAAVYSMYEKNLAIQDQLHEFYAVLERIGKQEQELEEFKASLATLLTNL